MHKFGMKYQVEAVRVLAERSYQFDIAVAAFEACLAGREDIFNVLMEFTQETTALEISVKLARAGKLEFVKRGLIGRHKLDKLFAESIASGTTELVKFLLEEMSGAVIGFALLAAARIGHIEVVKLLLGRSEPWDIQFYAFEEAAKAGQANVVDYLRQWCGPARVTTIKAGLTATGGEEAAALLDTKRARFE
ncbi:hypothetical protein V7S43_011634 [Phytophthora oleae]|uniref:Uncharacterized protein n=1 Tax=Phytophthora oleae TaxID=2107226 RepID=A0ABD3F8M8_9STRA